jgi:hypothetical protein
MPMPLHSGYVFANEIRGNLGVRGEFAALCDTTHIPFTLKPELWDGHPTLLTDVNDTRYATG